MDLETFIIAVFCLVDDFVRDLCRGRRLRQRGPAPILADSEVLTVEITGEFLSLDTDRGLHAYFRRHFGHLFPGLRTIHRTTSLRQAANLWAVNQDAAIVLIDSLPVPVCRFARAHRCRSFRGLAAFGYDPLAHQTYYGLRLHLRVTWPGGPAPWEWRDGIRTSCGFEHGNPFHAGPRLERGAIAQGRVQALPIVEDFDVVEHGCPGFLTRAEAGVVDVLLLE
jgi:hypothetical protein